MSILDPSPFLAANLAVSAKNAAVASQTLAASNQSAAQTAQTAAEAARDSVNTTGKVFADTTTGIAGTSSGQTFAVLDAGLQFWIVYKNNSGSAVEVARSYTKAYIDTYVAAVFETLDTSVSGTALLLDPAGKLIAQLPDPGVASLKGSAVAVSVFETLDTAASVYLLDSSDKLMVPIPAPSTALSDAAGTASTLAVRLGHGLSPYGDVLGPTYAEWMLRNSRMRLRQLKEGTATQCVIAAFGDSWIQGGYWLQQFAKDMQTAYGFAGLGFVGFQWFGTTSGTWVDGGSQPSGGGAGCARGDLSAAPVFNGTWTSDNGAGGLATPSIGNATTSSAGAYVRFSFPSGHNAADLYYAGDGTGVINYSWDGGATWQGNLALTGVGPSKVALANVPAGSASLRIQAVSGNVNIAGVDMKGATGVRVHKLGASGSNSVQWAAVNLTTWAAQIANLGPHLVIGLLATNDQSSATAPQTVANNAAALLAAVGANSAAIDRLWIAPPENNRTNTVAMSQYTAAVRQKAVDAPFSMLDLQFVFGANVNDYKYGSTLGLLNSTDLHPEPTTGGVLIAGSVLRLIAPIL